MKMIIKIKITVICCISRLSEIKINKKVKKKKEKKINFKIKIIK